MYANFDLITFGKIRDLFSRFKVLVKVQKAIITTMPFFSHNKNTYLLFKLKRNLFKSHCNCDMVFEGDFGDFSIRERTPTVLGDYSCFIVLKTAVKNICNVKNTGKIIKLFKNAFDCLQ